MTVFFALVISVVAVLHLYIGLRLIPATRARRPLWGLVALSAASIPLTFIGGRHLEPGIASTLLAWFGFLNLGIMGILAALVFVRDLLLVATRWTPRGQDPSRRAFLRRASAFGVLGAGGLFVADGLIGAARSPVVERVRVPIDGLPPPLRGFRIAQISDTHLGPTLDRDWLADVVRRVNGLQPDLIAVTGDLADGYVDRMRGDVEPIGDLAARHGVYFCTGNHEYYWRPEEWIPAIRALGPDVLLNEHRMIDVGGAKLAIGGVPDLRESDRFEGQRSDPELAFAGAEGADVKLLLAHQPGSLHAARRAGVDLQLSGHTHGGQVFPMNLLVHLAHPIVAGLGRFGDTWVYVNRGTAYWGPPLRTAGAGEITELELVRA